MISLDNELYPNHCLELSGLDESARHILQERGLKDEDAWLQLINLYEGHSPGEVEKLIITLIGSAHPTVIETIRRVVGALAERNAPYRWRV